MLKMETIILYCLKQLNSERTIYSIFHLLNGKKSSQTIQDAHLFNLKNLFGIYEPLTRESFEELIQAILQKKWIYDCGGQRFLLTSEGDALLNNMQMPHYFNGWRYHQKQKLFWERLSLFIQVTSNLVFNETKYIPIQKNKDVHDWLKSVLKNIHVPRNELGGCVYSELIDCFNETTEIDPSFLIFRLTGFRQAGLTSRQSADKLNVTIHDYHIGFVQTLHYLIEVINQDMNHYPVLSYFTEDIKQADELTLSSRKTWNLLNRGFTLDMIANQRHLKLSTIEDHLVEFAINVDDFSIDGYVDKELQTKILEISRLTASKQLKMIRERLKTATYFQIRLVLAKYGDS